MDLSIYRPVDDTVRMMGTEDTSLTAGDTFTVMASEGDDGMVVVNAGGGERSYTPVLAVSEQSTFTAESRTIDAKETHTITADDWEDLSAAGVVLAVDRGSDGTIDELIVLQGEVPKEEGSVKPPAGLIIIVALGLLVLATLSGVFLSRKRRR